MDKSSGYEVIFSVNKLSLYEQEEIYQSLIKILTFEQKRNFNIVINDPIGGKHFVFDNTGIQPNGKICNFCERISCEDCQEYEGI